MGPGSGPGSMPSVVCVGVVELIPPDSGSGSHTGGSGSGTSGSASGGSASGSHSSASGSGNGSDSAGVSDNMKAVGTVGVVEKRDVISPSGGSESLSGREITDENSSSSSSSGSGSGDGNGSGNNNSPPTDLTTQVKGTRPISASSQRPPLSPDIKSPHTADRGQRIKQDSGEKLYTLGVNEDVEGREGSEGGDNSSGRERNGDRDGNRDRESQRDRDSQRDRVSQREKERDVIGSYQPYDGLPIDPRLISYAQAVSTSGREGDRVNESGGGDGCKCIICLKYCCLDTQTQSLA